MTNDQIKSGGELLQRHPLFGTIPEFPGFADPVKLSAWIGNIRSRAFVGGARHDEIDMVEAKALIASRTPSHGRVSDSEDGRLPAAPGSCPDGSQAVSPVPASIPDASVDYTADDYDYDLGDCWNCGGEGYVYGCSWDWQCDTYDEGEGTCLCTRSCHICHPPKADPSLRNLMAKMLASDPSAPQGMETRQGGDSEAAPSRSDDSLAALNASCASRGIEPQPAALHGDQEG